VRRLFVCLCTTALLLAAVARADSYRDTTGMFRNAGQSASFFDGSYGYAVFPTIGRAGFGIGGAHGDGRVYVAGKQVGDTSMTQLSVGLQVGAEGYSEIIFFQDKRALDEFTHGNFEFGAGVSATVITASASGTTGTMGATAGASGGKNNATTAGGYHKGIAVFTITKGGAMAAAAVGGQKFSYRPNAAS
jgi:lipid-binding SYLF domain-containing protein